MKVQVKKWLHFWQLRKNLFLLKLLTANKTLQRVVERSNFGYRKFFAKQNK